MSEMDDDEYEYTRERYTHEIRRKNLLDCSEKELRIRCSFNERYIAALEKEIFLVKKELQKLKDEKGENSKDPEVEIQELDIRPNDKLRKTDKRKWEKEKKREKKAFERIRKEIEDR